MPLAPTVDPPSTVLPRGRVRAGRRARPSRVFIPTASLPDAADSGFVKAFMLIHKHTPAECNVAYAAWNGFDSPLRGQPVQSTCARHQSDPASAAPNRPAVHEIWWNTHAPDIVSAMAQLPPYVKDRTQAREVSDVTIR
jgi:hypothetical protein